MSLEKLPTLLRARLEKKTIRDPVTNCWLYSSVSNKGQARIYWDNKEWTVSRLIAYYCLGLNLDNPEEQANHKISCFHSNCWNPEHIYIGTQQDNMQDKGLSGHNVNSNKTHCRAGHPYSSENTRVDKKGCRHCKTCQREQDAAKAIRAKR